MIRLLFFVLMFSTVSFAQVERETEVQVTELNEQIKHQLLTRTYDQRTLLRVKNQLENVLDTLGGAVSTPGLQDRLKCVSKYNDGYAPFILALELNDFSLKKFSQYTFSSADSCKNHASSGRLMSGSYHTCVSKYNDGYAPMVIASFSGEDTTKRTETFASSESCLSSLKAARENSEAWAMCASKYNDGYSPYVRVVVKRDGTTSRQDVTYNSVEQCQQL